MRIVMPCGILDDDSKTPMWVNLSKAFADEYGIRASVERAQYHFTDQERMLEFRDYLVTKYDTGEPVMFVGHSMGGIIACAAAARMVRSRVIGIVTIHAPHTYVFGYFVHVLGAYVPRGIPIVSFGAREDWVVPRLFARHPRAIFHRTLPRGHHGGLIDEPRFARIIARYAKRYIRETGSS